MHRTDSGQTPTCLYSRLAMLKIWRYKIKLRWRSLLRMRSHSLS
ncbi:hypothetical protein [Scytonema sp. HK-05]|nr:hypothetical protein [Scytonema sp. HK-05]